MVQMDNDYQVSTENENQVEVPAGKREQQINEIRRNGKGKAFLSSLTAGVIGSALTLGVVSYTDSFSAEKAANNETAASNEIATNSDSIQTTQVSNGNASIADIVEKASQAIVGIVNIQQQRNYFSNSSQSVESGTGSGIIFRKEGDRAYIVTNNHVIEGANEVEVSLHNGEKTSAKLVGADALTDLAVLEIDAEHVTTVVDFGDSSTLRPGDQVLAIGNPLGLDLSRTVTQGIVSAVDRSITVSTSAGEWDLNVIQTDAAINPGNSGGALINTKGEVIGINSLKISENGVEGLGFAIPSNDFIPIVNEIIENGEVVRPYLGVSLASIEEIPRMYIQDLPEDITAGAVVVNIDPESSAARAGIKVQDVIVSINGEKVENSNDLRKYLYTKLDVGDEVELGIYRDGEPTAVTLTLTSDQQGI
ncbi:serine protease Do [Bacillus oleivorans]|uniref:Serine protease Do n=1 Tax=Bacillus oleivorans TaxID=1448271 RepID=A0A285CLY4_9BACI|nr:trypsin-like peptidase domain-containing protein [Bacillus oleivorans]SNX68023.1 serine protease Do [Bacillus oleivorans]